MRRLRIHSNINKFESATAPDVVVDHARLGPATDFRSLLREFRAARDADVLLVNNNAGKLMRMCLLSFLFGRRCYFVALDIVLGAPRTFRARVLARLRRLLLRQVDHFIVYQHDLTGYDRHYGVSPRRASTIPFKVNLWDSLQRGDHSTRDDGYLLFAGRTYRDVDTFVRACELSGVPAVMVRHSPDLARVHGTHIPDDRALPPNLHDVVDDAEERDGWLDFVRRCRGIVLPLQPGLINAAGISTLFDAMALGKPVIISRSPATEGIVTDREVALVPQGDARALADAMLRVYNDEDYRRSLVANGRRLAASLQGEARLNRDILNVVAVQA